MPRVIYNRFTNKEIQNLSASGRYADGGGLYLQITKAGSKSWIFRFMFNKNSHEMGLGTLQSKSLKEAREAAQICRDCINNGFNPLINNPFKTNENLIEIPTLKEFGLKMIEEWSSQWVNTKHIHQWKKSLTDYSGKLANMRVNEIETAHILNEIDSLWKTRPETAKRTLGRIKRVLDAAKIAKLRTGENPATWDGHLALILSKQNKLTRGHMKAVDYRGIQSVMKKLQGLSSVSASALSFTILTAVRTSEAINARKQEFDLEAKVWNIPAERMKMKRPHSVPLSENALKIIKEDFDDLEPEDFVFHNRKKPLSNMAMLMCLRGIMGAEEGYTVHGFRSTFRDWAGDSTKFPRELAEAALAHAVGDKTEQAYRRSDALERRRKLMQAWDNFIFTQIATDNVIQLLNKKSPAN